MIRKFAYNELGHDKPIEMTEEEILQSYYKFWSWSMIRAHKSPMISEERCIEDFVIIYWAWEIK